MGKNREKIDSMKETNSSNLQHEVLPDEDNLELIEQEKRQFDALKPKYSMPEETPTIIERAKRWLRDVFMDTCECGGTFYAWSSKKDVCDKCGRVK